MDRVIVSRFGAVFGGDVGEVTKASGSKPGPAREALTWVGQTSLAGPPVWETALESIPLMTIRKRTVTAVAVRGLTGHQPAQAASRRSSSDANRQKTILVRGQLARTATATNCGLYAERIILEAYFLIAGRVGVGYMSARDAAKIASARIDRRDWLTRSGSCDSHVWEEGA